MSEAELAGCIDWVAHGYEIVHTHSADWRFKAADTVADFALHGRLFVGRRVPIAAFADPARELAALHVALLEDGKVIDEGDATIVLDGPLTALRLWVDAMAVQAEQWPIVAGDIVTTGTITDAAPMRPGHRFESAPQRSAPARPGVDHARLSRRRASTRIPPSAPDPPKHLTGEVAEWSNAPDSKSGLRFHRNVGSNPTLSTKTTSEELSGRLQNPQSS